MHPFTFVLKSIAFPFLSSCLFFLSRTIYSFAIVYLYLLISEPVVFAPCIVILDSLTVH